MRLLDSLIARVVGSIVLPFIQIFGLYVAFHGHLSPGGGFAGGAVVGTSLVLVLLLRLPFRGKEQFDRLLTVFDSGGIIAFALVGLAGMVRGSGFLSNLSAGFPRGLTGSVFSAGFMVPLAVVICFKVASTITVLFSAMEEGRGDEGR